MEGKLSGPPQPGRGFPFGLEARVENEQLVIDGKGRTMAGGSGGGGGSSEIELTDFKVALNGTNLVSFYKFLDSSCKASFGFKNVRRVAGSDL